MPSHLLIVNVHSGGGRALQRAKSLVSGLPDIHDYSVVSTDGPGHAFEIARDAADAYDTLVAVGGDGTVCEVATGILASGHPHTRLGILPTGTGNDTAHGIGIHSWEEGLAGLSGTAVRAVDVCEVTYWAGNASNCRLSLVGCGVGYPAEVVARATKGVKRLLHHWAYYYAAVTAAASYRAPHMRIEADGKQYEGRYLMVALANVERTGGQKMRMAPEARCDDGRIHVVLVENASKLRLLAQLPRLASGGHIGLPEVSVFPAQNVRVVADPPARLNIDGDLEGETPATFHVLPGALTVRVPDTLRVESTA